MNETADLSNIITRRATFDEILQVRWDVLRPNRPVETAHFKGDHEPTTLHVGAFANGQNICCATATRANWQDQPAWQLRGMGVVKEWQKKGVGQQVLSHLEELARQSANLDLIWCNAREEAVKFYQKQGWQIASESFHIEDVGPHFKMTKNL
jgi:ribosomal-protein-alanine N-acetyltransferase